MDAYRHLVLDFPIKKDVSISIHILFYREIFLCRNLYQEERQMEDKFKPVLQNARKRSVDD